MLIAQLFIGAALLYGASTGFDFVLPDPPQEVRTTQTASTPSAPAPTAARAATRPDRFDAPQALRWAERQVALGPRPSKSRAIRRAGDLLRPALPNGRFRAVPDGLRNIEGRLPGEGAPVLVIAHYDTTPVKGYLGANNSAAGVGAVIEVARALRRDHSAAKHRPVVFLLTDGEEPAVWPPKGNFLEEGVRGSRHDAATRSPRPRQVIVMDFVAQKGLSIPREANSTPALWAQLRSAARRVGRLSTFPNTTAGAVEDDHVPYLNRGIPAIDLIDFDYACWQKTCDTLDKLDVRALDASGETVTELVRTLRGR